MSPSAPRHASGEQERLDLRAYARPIWRRKWLILLIVVLATAATYVLAAREPKAYVASTTVYFTVVNPAAAIGSVTPTTPPTAQDMQDISTLFTAQAITAAVYHQLGVPLGSAGSVNVAPLTASSVTSANTSFVVVTATSQSPRLAARLANTYVSVFLASRRSSESAAAKADASAAQTSLNTLANLPVNSAERQTLLLDISQYRTLVVNPSAGAQQIDRAVAPTSPSSPKPVRDALFAAIVGLLLAIGVAFGLELLDRRLVSVAALESIYGRPVLAALPNVPDPAPLLDGYAAVPPHLLEAMRGLRINLRLTGAEAGPHTLVVSSGFPDEGKSIVARALALVHANGGDRVLLIDADLRRPSIAWLFELEPEFGLSHVLEGKARLADAIIPAPIRDPHAAGTERDPRSAASGPSDFNGKLDVLGHGESVEDPVTLLSSPAMKGMLAVASKRYDVVIIDTAPILPVSDTLSLLGIADGVLLVARMGLTTRDAAEHLSEIIGRVPNAHLLGVVANDMRDTFLDEGQGGYYRGYGGYGGYGGHANGSPRGKTAAKTG